MPATVTGRVVTPADETTAGTETTGGLLRVGDGGAGQHGSSFDLRGSGLLLLLLLMLLQLLLSKHLQVGWGESLSLGQLHTCGWTEDSR
ncbi:hypothetical protein EYF80_020745 [Liparis tanakae]|uniref:Uncharacterized protein n=1 Tax=Liparis tanakae TaxID=230148 RepID=A0A4Z2HVW4_9TELE|nr:hypothetical protein EYF80_020745 [Liparis tanakae]